MSGLYCFASIIVPIVSTTAEMVRREGKLSWERMLINCFVESSSRLVFKTKTAAKDGGDIIFSPLDTFILLERASDNKALKLQT